MQALNKYTACILTLVLMIVGASVSFAQSIGGATTGTAVRISCAATGTSTQALALNFRRKSLTLQNKAGKQLRIGFLSSGTGVLDTTNSFVLEASSNYTDSMPGVYTGRVVCMSTDASTGSLDVTETQ